MSGIKKLASQTLWYGIPTIAARFLGYLTNFALPFITGQPEKTADLSQVYAIIPFMNVLYAYGLETAYFRFSQTHDKQKLYSTLSISLFFSSIIFTAILLLCQNFIADAAGLSLHPEYVLWMIAIIAVDNLNTLPFAKLRQENRPKYYAFARLSGIIVSIAVIILFIGIIPQILKHNPDSFVKHIYNKDIGLGYYLLGNLCGSLFTLLLLLKEIRQIKLKFSIKLWKQVMKYSLPLIIVGLGGMINDVMSRLIYRHVVHLPKEQADYELGIFSNIFRIALLITITIQAFRMAAEPFFFNRSNEENAPKIYARVMKFFVIACCFMFLFISLYLDVFRWIFVHFTNKNWADGLDVVPLLALGNIFLGIYYNLSVWYKLTNKNMYGAAITIAGAAITIALNILLIPTLHYTGAAIATFCCYLFMMVCSYLLGQKHFPVPYARRKLLMYLLTAVLLYAIHVGLNRLYYGHMWFSLSTATVLMLLFSRLISITEAKEMAKLPVIGKWFKKQNA